MPVQGAHAVFNRHLRVRRDADGRRLPSSTRARPGMLKVSVKFVSCMEGLACVASVRLRMLDSKPKETVDAGPMSQQECA
jgi:hypothetical protein